MAAGKRSIYTHVTTSKPRVRWSELTSTKASKLMAGHNLSEHGLQQEIIRHCNDASHSEKKQIFEKVYSVKE